MSDVAVVSEPDRHGAHALAVPAIGTGGFSRLRIARMKSALQRHVQSGLLPGFVALVYHRGR